MRNRFGALGRPAYIDRVFLADILEAVCRYLIALLFLHEAKSRATTKVPVSESLVLTGYLESSARTSDIGLT
jgi:hypothetical protein